MIQIKLINKNKIRNRTKISLIYPKFIIIKLEGKRE